MTNKTLIAAAVLTAVAGLTTLSVTKVAAQSENGLNLGQHLAQALGKSEDEVNQALHFFHELRHQEREAVIEQRLDEAVAAGTITQEQKQLLIEKHQEMTQDRELFLGMQDRESRQEHRQEMQQHHEEMQAWAEENDIDLGALQLGPNNDDQGGRQGRHMMR